LDNFAAAFTTMMMKRAASDCRPRVVTIPSGDTHKFAMSAIPPKADIAGRQLDVRFVPKADLLSPTQ
jgi:hypothetical protein